MYIQHLTKHFRVYINHCLICTINQTKRHKSYNLLVLINRLNVSFHTIIMNFVVVFLENLNSLLNITDKFLKRILFISNQPIYNVVKWINIMFTELMSYDWNIFNVIINDWDSKFMSFFWRIVFQKFQINLFTFTSYYSQTNDQFERINQTIKIVIRFFVNTNSKNF